MKKRLITLLWITTFLFGYISCSQASNIIGIWELQGPQAQTVPETIEFLSDGSYILMQYYNNRWDVSNSGQWKMLDNTRVKIDLPQHGTYILTLNGDTLSGRLALIDRIYKKKNN